VGWGGSPAVSLASVRSSTYGAAASMCEQLSELREAIGRYAAVFNVSLLDSSDVDQAVAHAAAIEAMAATLKSLAAARAADNGSWRREGIVPRRTPWPSDRDFGGPGPRSDRHWKVLQVPSARSSWPS
jgi:hypothetical protein